MCLIRDYDRADYDACLGILVSNMPVFFGEREKAAYAGFLTELPCSYLVAELSGNVVGCGGFYIVPDEGRASLVWGMVAQGYQRRGVGSALLETRLARLLADRSVRFVRTRTSQRTAAFFERFGFQTERIQEHHFGPGLHLHEMYLRTPAGSANANRLTRRSG